MKIFNFINRKKLGYYNVLKDDYVPASLPSFGNRLENFVPADYPMNNPEEIKAAYRAAENHLNDIIATCDQHSVGSECDQYIDGAIKHLYALHEATIANNENQIARINSARDMRKSALDRMISPLREKVERLQAEIKPLEVLQPQFQLHIGEFTVSLGMLITVISMIVDAFVNWGFLQNLLNSNATLLMITVICMSVMSDASMYVLGTFIAQRHEKFTSKKMFWMVCIGLASMFMLSVVASIMIRYGSMPDTFGMINSSGQVVPKEDLTLADYGVTLITAFVTTATGLLSFAFSLDENSFPVSIRERKKKELVKCTDELELLLNERTLIEKAPNLFDWDRIKRVAAVQQMESTRIGLKLHCRKLLTLRIKDADFTERMAEGGVDIVNNITTVGADNNSTVVTLNKVA